jgi:AsmA protein
LPAGTTLKGGTLSAHFSLEGPADRLVVTGSLALDKTRLTGFDLSKKMVSVEKFAGLKAGPDMEIETLSTELRSSPEGTTTQAMKLVVPALGEVTGAGTVSPADQLDFKMSAMVHTTGLMSVVADKPIPFSVTGTASEPVFKPDIGAVAKEEIKSIGKDAEKAAGGLLKGLFDKKKTK